MGATLTSEKESVMRREAQSVHLSPHGEMVKEAPHKMVKEAPELSTNYAGKLTAKEYAKLSVDYCNYDFVLGTDTAPGNCSQANESIIDETTCIFAQTLSGAGVASSGFSLDHDERYENSRPKGCFKYSPCGGVANGVCYFYNTIETTPNDTYAMSKYSEAFGGTPVCYRPKYVLGTNDTNAGCPGGYKAITSEDTTDQLQHENLCFLTANCMGQYAAATDFRIGEHNASKHLDFPRGCFVDNDGLVDGNAGKVYFNAKTAEGFGADGAVKGTPICKVNSYVKWDASGTEVATEVVADDDYSKHDKARHDAGDRDTKAVAAATAAR